MLSFGLLVLHAMHREKKGAKAAATIAFSVRLIYRYDWYSPKMPAGLSPQEQTEDYLFSGLDWESRMKTGLSHSALSTGHTCTHPKPEMQVPMGFQGQELPCLWTCPKARH